MIKVFGGGCINLGGVGRRLGVFVVVALSKMQKICNYCRNSISKIFHPVSNIKNRLKIELK